MAIEIIEIERVMLHSMDFELLSKVCYRPKADDGAEQ
jgi:hypothetical protein